MNPDTRDELTEYVSKYLREGKAVVTQGAQSTQLTAEPMSQSMEDLRTFQVQEVSRIYGLPSLIVGLEIVNWNQGVETLAKIAYRFGFRPHLDRFLSVFANRLLRRGERFLPDTHDLLRGDSADIAKLIMATAGDAQREPTLTREERRRIAGVPRDHDGEFPDWPPKKAGDEKTVDKEIEDNAIME